MAIFNIDTAQNDFVAYLASEWRKEKAALEIQMDREKSARDALIQACGKDFEGFGVKVEEIERKGSIEYSAIPEIAGVDLEKYRKPSVKYMQVKPSVKE